MQSDRSVVLGFISSTKHSIESFFQFPNAKTYFTHIDLHSTYSVRTRGDSGKGGALVNGKDSRRTLLVARGTL